MNFKNLALSLFLFAFLLGCSKDNDTSANNTNTDQSGSVTIGTQVWTTKNLDVDHYRNGDPIPQVTDPTQWASLTTGAWCYYNNDSANGAIYSKLYNWYAVKDPRGLAPEGWHVPSDAEWTTLGNYLGGLSIAGGKLKEVGTAHWLSPNTDATNSSGFSALPGGWRYNGAFSYIGSNGCWWSSTVNSTTDAWSRDLYSIYADFSRSYRYVSCGFSVRCVRD